MMIQTQLTHDQATKLAAFVHSLRPDWDKPGILDALGRARTKGTATDVAVAAIRCATSGKARTPGVIPMDGEHWRNPAPPSPANTGTAVLITGRCTKCGHLHPPADPCIRPLEETQAAGRRHASEARALIHSVKSNLCPCGVLPRDCADHRPEPSEETA